MSNDRNVTALTAIIELHKHDPKQRSLGQFLADAGVLHPKALTDDQVLHALTEANEGVTRADAHWCSDCADNVRITLEAIAKGEE